MTGRVSRFRFGTYKMHGWVIGFVYYSPKLAGLQIGRTFYAVGWGAWL